MVEASIYMNYYYMTLLRNNLDQFPKSIPRNFLLQFYYDLKLNTTQTEWIPIDRDYFENIRTANRPIYGSSYRSHLIQSAVVQHETAMKNYILVHLRRIVCYLKLQVQVVCNGISFSGNGCAITRSTSIIWILQNVPQPIHRDCKEIKLNIISSTITEEEEHYNISKLWQEN
ncbi:hypothetical protein ABEB36_007468 [Hypothenemus hampei]|uniref:Uncharacterized protein n=1 Tax=Hypothenemus hampei TaxID=57062 RepID=A0ABD1EWG3_HYPHA